MFPSFYFVEIHLRLLVLLLICWPLFFSGPALGQQCEYKQQCLPTGQWQLGLAIGLGISSNPLKDGDNIPMIVLPDVAWYGESAYFDNGELGYQWLNKQQNSFVTYTTFDSERAYFSFWHPANLLMSISEINSSSANDVTNISGPELITGPEKISIDNVAKRNWALMAGVRWYIYQASGQWEFSYEHDISGVHNGQKIDLSYQHNWLWSDFTAAAKVTLQWKSSRLYDYYYGIDQRDLIAPAFYYNANSGWQPKLTLTMQKRINSSWLWLNRVSHQMLPSAMTNSPLIEEGNIYSVFSGFAYRF